MTRYYKVQLIREVAIIKAEEDGQIYRFHQETSDWVFCRKVFEHEMQDIKSVLGDWAIEPISAAEVALEIFS